MAETHVVSCDIAPQLLVALVDVASADSIRESNKVQRIALQKQNESITIARESSVSFL